ncbi:MAG: alpha-mannosidase, partial [Clostridia bacterium]|nr:alpha-mannosidase [Clostridia bacterium]
MSRLDGIISRLDGVKGGKMWERLKYELRYARRVSQAMNGRHEALVLEAAGQVLEAAAQEGAITDARALAIEQALMPMQADCRKYRLIICGHAHIDMNWMWRYDETVQVTLDTFRTVLNLMEEFPQFTFSQSQASVYRIMEEFAPEMLEEIRARAKEGRWEVTASTWVEADRNMPNAESVARHHLYTAAYLKELGLTPSLVDFEPDTFGHHQNTPELLSQAGVKYYYHCRGLEGQTLYRWRAPSGAEVLAYCEPFWYKGSVDGDFAQYAPAFCETFGTDCALRVYGVGDHGGGPTRRDILRAIDMQSWPIYATVEFGTFHRFFESASRAAKEIPVVDRELNPLFLGCYTTQTRVKKGNRYAERILAEAEQLNAFAWRAAGAPYRGEKFREGWRNVLFNQFHDILPGSGVTDTREYAMGLYQQAYAVANSARRQAMKAIADRIDTSAVAVQPFEDDISTGAGVGFRVEETVNPAPVEVGRGRTRVFHLFNSCAFDRREVTELTLWDMKAEAGRLRVTDEAGHPLRFQVIESGHNAYWGHDFTRVMVEASVPAAGYATCVVAPEEDADEPLGIFQDWRVERDETWTIENDRLIAECDPAEQGGAILLTDKATGELHIIDGFHFVVEDGSRGMTAWVSGDPVSDERLQGIRMRRTARGPLYNELTATAPFGRASEITYTIGLRACAARLDIGARVRWLEPGDQEKR